LYKNFFEKNVIFSFIKGKSAIYVVNYPSVSRNELNNNILKFKNSNQYNLREMKNVNYFTKKNNTIEQIDKKINKGKVEISSFAQSVLNYINT
jgi:hypothetical protein